MKYDDAKKLLSEDDVTVKETGEVVRVLSTITKGPNDGLRRPTVFIETVSKDTNYWAEYMHTEVK